MALTPPSCRVGASSGGWCGGQDHADPRSAGTGVLRECVPAECFCEIAHDGEGVQGFLTDRSGSDVLSALDATGLRRIAERTGGTYVEAGAAAGSLVKLHDERIVQMGRRVSDSEGRRRPTNRFQWPLLLAFGFWMLAFGLTDRRRA